MSLKVLSRVFALTSLLWWSCAYFLTNRYEATRPTLSDNESGRTYPLYSHGHVVYLNGSETFRVYGSMSLAVFSVDKKSRQEER